MTIRTTYRTTDGRSLTVETSDDERSASTVIYDGEAYYAAPPEGRLIRSGALPGVEWITLGLGPMAATEIVQLPMDDVHPMVIALGGELKTSLTMYGGGRGGIDRADLSVSAGEFAWAYGSPGGDYSAGLRRLVARSKLPRGVLDDDREVPT